MYKLILLDFYMPEMNGDEVVSRIKQIFKDIKTVKRPYICCISAGDVDVENKMKQVGCDDIQSPPLLKDMMKI